MAAQHPPELVAALAAGLSANADEREASRQFLQQHQDQPGFQYELVRIVTARDTLDVNVRLQAIIQFKNGIERYWRRGAPHVIDAQGKSLIRALLLELVDEPHRPVSLRLHERELAQVRQRAKELEADTVVIWLQTANTLAECVGRIARMDYKQDWPELFETILSRMQQALEAPQSVANPRIVLHRCLMYLFDAVATLSSNRMQKGKAVMGELLERSFATLVSLHRHFYSVSMSAIEASSVLADSPAEALPEDAELSLFTLEIISKLVTYGGEAATTAATRHEMEAKAAFAEVIKEFVHSTVPDFLRLQSIRKAKALHGQLTNCAHVVAFNNHLLAYGGFYEALLMQNHLRFHELGVTQQLTEICWTVVDEASQNVAQLVSEDAIAVYPQAFVVQCILFVKKCFTGFPTAWKEFSSPEFASRCVETIVQRLLLLRQPDLTKWQEDPEEWIKEEEDEKWQYDVRPAAGAYLQDLIKNYTDTVAPLLIQYMQNASVADSLEQVLQKEAIYAAFAMCPTELGKFVNFGSWLRDSLVVEGTSVEPTQVILRRRIAWLVGEWVGEGSDLPTITMVYQLVAHLMQEGPSTDLATRLTAVKAMGKCDTWEFDTEAFLPVLDTTMRELSNLLVQVELPETRANVNRVLGVVITRVGRHVSPYLDQLLSILPAVWTGADPEDPIKASIVVTLTKLVEALQGDSQVIQALCCDCIQNSCGPDSESTFFLQEDGLDLWKSLLRYAPEPTQPLMDLAPLAVQLVTDDSEILLKVLRIVESYILLSPEPFLNTYANAIMREIAELLIRLDDKACKPLLYTTDLLLQSCPPAIWAPALHTSGAVGAMLRITLSSAPATTVTRYLCTLSRIAIADTNIFHELLRGIIANPPVPELALSYDELLRKLLAQWLDRYDNLSYPGQRKLVALGLTYVARSTNPVILDRFDEIITTWLSALGETEETASGEYVNSSDDMELLLQETPSSPSPNSLIYPGIQQVQSPLRCDAQSSSSEPPSPVIFDEERRGSVASSSSSVSSMHYDDTMSHYRNDSCNTYASSNTQDSVFSSTVTTPGGSPTFSTAKWLEFGTPRGYNLRGRDNGSNDLSEGNDGGDTSWSSSTTATPMDGFTASNTFFTDFSSPLSSSADYGAVSSFAPHSVPFVNTASFNTTIPFAFLHAVPATFDTAASPAPVSLFDMHNHVPPPPPDRYDDNHDFWDTSAESYYNQDEAEGDLDVGWGADGWGTSAEDQARPAEEIRLKALIAQDSLHTQKLTVVVSAAIQDIQEMNGGAQLFQQNVLAEIDPLVLKELYERLAGIAKAGD